MPLVYTRPATASKARSPALRVMHLRGTNPSMRDLEPASGSGLGQTPDHTIDFEITCGYVPSWMRLDTVSGDQPPPWAHEHLPDDPELRELMGEFCWQ
jgi:hypothetical protein